MVDKLHKKPRYILQLSVTQMRHTGRTGTFPWQQRLSETRQLVMLYIAYLV